MDRRTAKKNSRSWLRHRFAQFLLNSSCSTTTSAASTALERFSGCNPAVHGFKIDRPSPTAAAGDFRARRIPPLVQVSINCGGAARLSVDSSEPLLLIAAKSDSRNKGRRVVDKHGECSKNRPPAPPSSLLESNFCYYVNPKREKTSKKKKKKKRSHGKCDTKRRGGVRLSRNACGFSSSSSFDSENELSLFSCLQEDDEDEEEESATLFSSKSFSSDSSVFYCSNRKKKKKKDKKEKKKSSSKSMKSTRRPPRRRNNGLQSPSSFSSTSTEQGKETAAGVAVVKKSSNPYMDFRSSMMEMIVERRLKSRKELERLLHSYLLLNSACHHPVIQKAFSDVWEAISCCLD